jgi:hypothetical protein
MPQFSVRNREDVPAPVRASKAVREAQLEYEGFIQAINGDVGELELGPEDQLRSVKVRLRRAANRLDREIEIWDANGRVYFRPVVKRGRPRKSAM